MDNKKEIQKIARASAKNFLMSEEGQAMIGDMIKKATPKPKVAKAKLQPKKMSSYKTTDNLVDVSA